MEKKILTICLIIGISPVPRAGAHFEPALLKNAENKTASECITGGLRSTSDLDITTTALIAREGYPVEEHVVLTEDGYYLTMHRIPGERNARPVLVQHGILCSSYEWVANGRGRALGSAFILADRGYDVWLGNFRGNVYSRCHREYGTSREEYWNFSFHEMGVFDLPAEVTYISRFTGKKLLYIGHSMGTTASYVMAIERSDVASKIKAMISLAPVVNMTNGRCVIHSILQFLYENGLLFYVTGRREFLPQTAAVKNTMKNLCYGSQLQRKFCMNLFFAVNNMGQPRSNYYTMTPKIFSHFAAGSSTKTVAHFYQIRISDRFQRYDYGPEENLARYGDATPPEYDLSKISLPVALFWSENDAFAHPLDVKRFSEKLPNRILDYRVRSSEFNHLDFLYAADAYEYLYSKMLSLMKRFE